MSWCARGSSDSVFRNARGVNSGRNYPWRRVGVLCLFATAILLSTPGLEASASMALDNSVPTLLPALGPDGIVMERPGSLLPDIDQVLKATGSHSAIAHATVANIGARSKFLTWTAIWNLSFVTTLISGLLYLSYPAGCKMARKLLVWCDARAMGVRKIVDVDSVDFNDLTTPAAVRNRGWSPELMARLLGAPDYAIVDPRNRLEPLVFISRKRVECLETTRAFHRDIETQKRQAEASDLQVSKWISLQEGGGASLRTVREGVR